jgi:hypothetical protein
VEDLQEQKAEVEKLLTPGSKVGEITLAEKTVVLSVRTSIVGMQRKVSTDEIEAQADKESLNVQKILMKSKSLDKLKSIRGLVNREVGRIAVPVSHFRRGTYLLPVQLVELMEGRLNKMSLDWDRNVGEFMAEYPQVIAEARDRLDGLFNPDDYASVEALRNNFRFEWNYSVAQTPQSLQGISKSLFEREQSRAAEQWQSAEREIRVALREGFSGLVEHFVERLTPDEDGKKKVFRSSFVEGFRDFLETFDGRNLTDDKSLNELVEKAKKVMAGVDVDSLRKDDNIRDRVLGSFENLKDSTAELVVKKSRAISFDED